jgi:hypothetical protein
MGRAGMAELLGWSTEAFGKAFDEVSAQGMVKADFELAPLAFISNAVKHNPPQSPNVVKSWRGTWSDLPECPLKLEIWQALKAFLDGMGEAFREAFAESCPKPSPNQEQHSGTGLKATPLARSGNGSEAVSHSVQTSNAGANDLVDPAKGTFLRIPLNDGSEYNLHVKTVEDWSREFPALDVPQELRGSRGYWLARQPHERKSRHNIRQSLRWYLSQRQDGAVLPEEWADL